MLPLDLYLSRRGDSVHLGGVVGTIPGIPYLELSWLLRLSVGRCHMRGHFSVSPLPLPWLVQCHMAGGALVGEAFLVPSIPSFMPMYISLLLTHWDAEVDFGGRWNHPWAIPPEAQALSLTLPTLSTLSPVS